MNKIEKLLKELCPKGVEFRALQDVCNLRAGERITTSMMSDEFEFPVMGGGVEPTGYYSSYNFENVVTIARAGSAGFVSFQKNKFWATDVCFVASAKTELYVNIKYVFYFLKHHEYELKKHLYGGSMPKLEKRYLWEFQIPLPPLKVQEEIVTILDTFTELESELESELKARRRQYEYYRNKLLSFEYLDKNGGGYEKKSLGEIGTFTRGNGLQKKDFKEFGIPCIHYGQIYTFYGIHTHKTISFVSKETAKKLKKAKRGDLIIAEVSENKEDVCKAVVYLGDSEVCISGHSFAFSHKQNPKYIAYFFQTHFFQDQKIKYTFGTKVITVHIDNLRKIQIPLPPLKVQEEIVKILDQFDTLVNDLNSGIPREIELRKKQYEYYREKLLNFERRE